MVDKEIRKGFKVIRNAEKRFAANMLAHNRTSRKETLRRILKITRQQEQKILKADIKADRERNQLKKKLQTA